MQQVRPQVVKWGKPNPMHKVEEKLMLKSYEMMGRLNKQKTKHQNLS
jgi:hypothetical protein